jgi:hypothetical protein
MNDENTTNVSACGTHHVSRRRVSMNTRNLRPLGLSAEGEAATASAIELSLPPRD